MPALLIKDLPTDIHRQLKEQAAYHRRSMTQQAIVLLKQGLNQVRPVPAFTPFKGRHALANQFINVAKRDGRA